MSINSNQSHGLVARGIQSGAALAAGTIVERVVRFARNMVLARILAPDQFGISAIVIACSAFFEAVTDVGTGVSIIQKKSGDDTEYLNSVWWFNAVRGTLLVAAGLILAPLIAWFYRDPQLTLYLRVAFFAMFWNGLTSTGMYAKQRNLNFGTTVWITQGSGFAGTIFTLVLALFIQNVWVLVIGLVFESIMRFLLSFLLCPIKPHLPIDREAFSHLSSFSRGMAGLPILTFLVLQADVFVLGRVATKETLGMYYLALSLANIPVMVFTKVANPLILPVFSRMQDDLERLKKHLLNVTLLIWLFGLPMAAAMGVFAPSILSVVFGNEYASMAIPFTVLSVYFIFYISGTPIAAIYIALGKPGLHRNFALLRFVLVSALIYPAALFFGPIGVTTSLLVSLFLAFLLQVNVLGKILDLPIGRYFLTIGTSLPFTAIVIGIGIAFRLLWKPTEIISLVACIALCLAAWSAVFFSYRKSILGVLREKSGRPKVPSPGLDL